MTTVTVTRADREAACFALSGDNVGRCSLAFIEQDESLCTCGGGGIGRKRMERIALAIATARYEGIAQGMASVVDRMIAAARKRIDKACESMVGLAEEHVSCTSHDHFDQIIDLEFDCMQLADFVNEVTEQDPVLLYTTPAEANEVIGLTENIGAAGGDGGGR